MGGHTIVIPQKIAVIGLGASGKSAYRTLTAGGHEVQVFTQGSVTEEERQNFRLTDEEYPQALAEMILAWHPQVAVVSPGISIHSALLSILKKAGIVLWSEVELAWRLQAEGTHSHRPWILVTGTNGKTTTVGLLTQMLRTAGENVAEVGNVGLPISSQVDSAAEVFVVEISSFQLETSSTLCPQASLCLNIETDHLDWHGSIQEYQQAKGKVFDGTQEARVYFADDQLVAGLAKNAARAGESVLLPLTLSTPSQGQIGVKDGWIVDARFGETPLVELGTIPFYQQRNQSSALLQDIVGATALALVHGVSSEAIRLALSEFEPDKHRQEIVGEFGGVTWIDDSKATNAHAAAAALKDLDDGTVIWVAGGDPKGQDFSELVQEVSMKLRGVVLIGKERATFRRALEHFSPDSPIVEVVGQGTPLEWMSEVIQVAQEMAQPGDHVVLAPACASWDQFTGYSQRGDIFAVAVNRHLAEVGNGHGASR